MNPTDHLKAARREHGLLINFGSFKFEIRKFAWTEGEARRTKGARRISGWHLASRFAGEMKRPLVNQALQRYEHGE